MKNFRTGAFLFVLFVSLLVVQLPTHANSLPLTVSVGYADNIHCTDFGKTPLDCLTAVNPMFPNPWQGSAGVNFIGQGITTAPGVPTGFDAGGLLLVNNTGADVSVSDVMVTIGSNTFDLWGSFVVGKNGGEVILTQTSDSTANFDTSDTTPSNGGGQCCTNENLIPGITFKIGANTFTLMDQNQILNTGGFDLGCKTTDCVSTNEAHPWELIPGQVVATPEPSSFLLLGSGLLWLGAGFRRKFHR
jgi:hypothetical protein